MLRCPLDNSRIIAIDETLVCEENPAHTYLIENGITHLLAPEHRTLLVEETHQLTEARRQQGFQIPNIEDFKQLPQTALSGWTAGYWTERAYAMAALWRVLERIRLAAGEPPVGPKGTAADLSDGLGWVGYGLDVNGYTTFVISQDTGVYGLGAFPYARYRRIFASLEAPPLAPKSFDVVVLSFSLHLTTHPERTLQNAIQLLAKGGYLIVMLTQHDHESLAETTLRQAGLTVKRERMKPMAVGAKRISERLLNRIPRIPPLIIAHRER